MQPVSLAAHFSKHWLLLLSDVLVDVGYSSSSTHALATTWVAPTPAPRPDLVLTTPEETLTLAAPDLAGRRVWQRALTQAILATLGRREGAATPPATRHASYTFTKGALRGARYEGAWYQGRAQGRGRMEYGDGWVHQGWWRGGERHGRGRAEGPGGEVREGVWERGRLGGRGRVVGGGGEYQGGLEDGQPHGHGIR